MTWVISRAYRERGFKSFLLLFYCSVYDIPPILIYPDSIRTPSHWTCLKWAISHSARASSGPVATPISFLENEILSVPDAAVTQVCFAIRFLWHFAVASLHHERPRIPFDLFYNLNQRIIWVWQKVLNRVATLVGRVISKTSRFGTESSWI